MFCSRCVAFAGFCMNLLAFARPIHQPVPLRWGEIKISVEAFSNGMLVGYVNRAMERLNIKFTSNSKRKFVPRDQVSPLLVVYSSLFQPGVQHKLEVSRNFLSIRIVLSCFYLLISCSEKFLTWISRAWNWFSRGNLPAEYWHEQLGWRDNTLCFALSKISDRALSWKSLKFDKYGFQGDEEERI